MAEVGDGGRFGGIVEDVVEEFQEVVLSEELPCFGSREGGLADEFVAVFPKEGERVKPLGGAGLLQGFEINPDHS